VKNDRRIRASSSQLIKCWGKNSVCRKKGARKTSSIPSNGWRELTGAGHGESQKTNSDGVVKKPKNPGFGVGRDLGGR